MRRCPDGLGLPEVKGSAVHRRQLSGGDGTPVRNRSEGGGVQLEHLLIDPAAAVQIEEGVVGHVEGGLLIAGGPVGNPDAVFLRQRVGDVHDSPAGKALLMVVLGSERDGVCGLLLHCP